MKIATAESCTAGMLSGRLTEVPGASSVFECGVAAYSKEIKHDVLGVPEDMLEELEQPRLFFDGQEDRKDWPFLQEDSRFPQRDDLVLSWSGQQCSAG